MEKQCSVCKETKNINEFYQNGWYKDRKKYKPSCKPCENKHHREAYIKIINKFYGGFKCVRCGFEGHKCQFDIHHRNPEEKDFGLAKRYKLAYQSPKRFIKEIEKCDLLCANCHRLEHLKYE